MKKIVKLSVKVKTNEKLGEKRYSIDDVLWVPVAKSCAVPVTLTSVTYSKDKPATLSFRSGAGFGECSADEVGKKIFEKEYDALLASRCMETLEDLMTSCGGCDANPLFDDLDGLMDEF